VRQPAASATLGRLSLALGLLGGLPAPTLAAGAAARASVNVVEAVRVNAWLGVPVSVQDLLLAQNAPAGPGTGALVPRVPGPTPPAALRLLPPWITGALDARESFGIDLVPAPDAAMLPRGLAAAVSAEAVDAGDGGPPLVITVAFN